MPIPAGSRHLQTLLVIALAFLVDMPESLQLRPSPDKRLPETLYTRIASQAFLEPPGLRTLNPQQISLARLGRDLFFDTRFSANQQISCATCHSPALGFTDGQPTGQGLATGDRNTPALFNLRLQTWFFWDGRSTSLIDQVLQPLQHPGEHGLSYARIALRFLHNYGAQLQDTLVQNLVPDEARDIQVAIQVLSDLDEVDAQPHSPEASEQLPQSVAIYSVATLDSYKLQKDLISQAARLSLSPQDYLGQRIEDRIRQRQPAIKEWYEQFNKLTSEQRQAIHLINQWIARALASYVEQLISSPAPFDRFVSQLKSASRPEEAFTADFGNSEWRGFQHFINQGCANCHHGFNFSDGQFHNIGLANRNDHLDLGRIEGLMKLKQFANACQSESNSEACRELFYTDLNSQESVGAFKTPSLRNLSLTAPYMHDGRFATLDEVLDHYFDLPPTPAVGHRDESIQTFALDQEARSELKSFLKSLDAQVSALLDTQVASAK